jgi:hypothetical protein
MDHISDSKKKSGQVDDMKLVKYVSAKGTQIAHWVGRIVCERERCKKG